MSRWTSLVGGCSMLLLAACGSDGDGSTDSTAGTPTTSTTVAAVTTDEPGTAATDPPTGTEATGTEATGPGVAGDDTAPPVAGALSADCLQGDWLLDNATTAALIESLLPGFPVSADGSMAMTFTGNDVEHFINVVVTFHLPEGEVSGPLDQRFAGTYEIDDDVLAITNDSIEGGWGNLTGSVGGVSVDVPVPPADLPAMTGGPATCDDDELAVQYTSGLADSVAVFTRTG